MRIKIPFPRFPPQDLRVVGVVGAPVAFFGRIRVVGPGSRLVMPASWLVAMAMAKAMPPREVKALTPQAQHQSLFMQRSALMPDGAAALTAENLFPTRTCDAKLCTGTGECNEECDRLKSTFVTSIPGKRLGFYHSTKQIPFDGYHPNIKVGVIVTSGVLRDAELQICRMLNALVANYGSLEAVMEEVVVVAGELAGLIRFLLPREKLGANK